MAEVLVTTNKDVEGTKSADVITLISGSAEVESGKGSDIVIDDSKGGNEVDLGQGDDLMKVYVDANLLSENEYEGGKGSDTLMLMLNKTMFDAWMATSLVYEFEHNKGEFDFSDYQSILGVNLRWEVESFERLILNRIASAEDDHYAVGENEVLNVDLAHNVLLNDDDSIAENKMIVAYGTKDVNGNVINNHMSEAGIALVLNPDGTISYDPRVVFDGLNTGQSVDDKFYYELRVSDPNSSAIVSTSVATVTITVNGVTDNHAPEAQALLASVNEDNILNSQVVATDQDINDTLTYSIPVGDGPSHGSLVMNADGTFTYTPVLNYFGPDSFTYQVIDEKGAVDTATVDITVNLVNDAPVAVGASFVMDDSHPTDTARIFQFFGNIGNKVSDVDGDPLTISLVSGPSKGSLQLNDDGTFIYTSNGSTSTTPLALAPATFTYKATDNSFADSNIATVSITVPIYGTEPVDGIGGNDALTLGGGTIAYTLGGDDVITIVSGNPVIYTGDGHDTVKPGGLAINSKVMDFDVTQDTIDGLFFRGFTTAGADNHIVVRFDNGLTVGLETQRIELIGVTSTVGIHII